MWNFNLLVYQLYVLYPEKGGVVNILFKQGPLLLKWREGGPKSRRILAPTAMLTVSLVAMSQGKE